MRSRRQHRRDMVMNVFAQRIVVALIGHIEAGKGPESDFMEHLPHSFRSICPAQFEPSVSGLQRRCNACSALVQESQSAPSLKCKFALRPKHLLTVLLSFHTQCKKHVLT